MLHLTYMYDEPARSSAQSDVDENGYIHEVEHIDRDHYSLSIDDLVTLFAQAGVPRKKRTIQDYCQMGEIEAVRHKAGKSTPYFANRQSALRKIEETVQIDRLAQMRAGSQISASPHPDAHNTNQQVFNDAEEREGAQSTTQDAELRDDIKPSNSDDEERNTAQVSAIAEKAIEALNSQLASVQKSLEEARLEAQKQNEEANAELFKKEEELSKREIELLKQKEATGFLYSYAHKMENEGAFQRAWRNLTGKKLLPDPSKGYNLEEVTNNLPRLE